MLLAPQLCIYTTDIEHVKGRYGFCAGKPPSSRCRASVLWSYLGIDLGDRAMRVSLLTGVGIEQKKTARKQSAQLASGASQGACLAVFTMATSQAYTVLSQQNKQLVTQLMKARPWSRHSLLRRVYR